MEAHLQRAEHLAAELADAKDMAQVGHLLKHLIHIMREQEKEHQKLRHEFDKLNSQVHNRPH